jgi:hypothetical protein
MTTKYAYWHVRCAAGIVGAVLALTSALIGRVLVVAIAPPSWWTQQRLTLGGFKSTFLEHLFNQRCSLLYNWFFMEYFINLHV